MKLCKVIALDLFLKEHLAMCRDDFKEVREVLWNGFGGYESMTEAEALEMLEEQEMQEAYQEAVNAAVISMAQRTWGCIGADIFEAMARSEIDAENVREVIKDADHMAAYGGNTEVYEWFQEQSREVQNELMVLAFPTGVYSK